MKTRRKNIITAALLAVAALLVAAGMASGQHEQVMAKETRICLECIGIG